MPFYEKGPVRIHYTEMGSGFPLMIIPGGGLNSTIAGLDVKPGHPFNAQKEFSNAFRCIVADIRNANAGQSTGPLDIERTWDAITDDHVGLMDHLGIKKFMVLGYCIGQPLIWNLIKRVGDRVVAAVLTQPSVRQRIMTIGALPVGKSPADFEAMLKADYEATQKLVAQIGLKVD